MIEQDDPQYKNRQLDALIAIEYFGWRWHKITWRDAPPYAILRAPNDEQSIPVFVGPDPELIGKTPGNLPIADTWDQGGRLRAILKTGDRSYLPHFQSNFAHTKILLNSLAGQYWWQLRGPFQDGDQYVAGITEWGFTGWNGMPDFQGFGPTPEHALCDAAIAVIRDQAPVVTSEGERIPSYLQHILKKL